jgi:phosphoribosylformylglycinamidine synthase
VDLDYERRLHGLLADGVARGLIRSAHDVASGGLAVALAESTFTGPDVVGATVQLRASIRPDALLFGESTGRIVATTSDADALLGLAGERGVPAERVGETGGDKLSVGPARGEPWLDAPIHALRERWRRAIPRRLETS